MAMRSRLVEKDDEFTECMFHAKGIFCEQTARARRSAMTKARGKVKKILEIIGELQSHIGKARAYHENDRDPNGYVLGQKELESAFQLCVDATSLYEPIDLHKGRDAP